MPMGRDPKTVDWHKMGEPMPINEKMRDVRIGCLMIAAFGLIFLVIGITLDSLAIAVLGLLIVASAFAILISWMVIKKDYAKNYERNLRQWKKTKKYNGRRT